MPLSRDATPTEQLLFWTQEGDVARMQDALERGANVNARDHHGITPLMLAAGGHAEALRLLLDQDADIQAQDSKGHTALSRAAHPRWSRVHLPMLLERGAKASPADALQLAVFFSALAQDSESPDNLARLELLLGAGAQLTPLDGGDSSGIATMDIAGMTRRRGGATLLMQAAANDQKLIGRLLLHFGAPINGVDKEGKTALMVAAEKGCINMTQLLLQGGADVHLQDAQGRSALQWTKEPIRHYFSCIMPNIMPNYAVPLPNTGEHFPSSKDLKSQTQRITTDRIEVARLLKDAGARD